MFGAFDMSHDSLFLYFIYHLHTHTTYCLSGLRIIAHAEEVMVYYGVVVLDGWICGDDIRRSSDDSNIIYFHRFETNMHLVNVSLRACVRIIISSQRW